jgi:hypothetical protein
MNVSSASSVVSYLQQQSGIQKQNNDLDGQIADSVNRARQDAMEQSMQENNKVAEQVSKIKEAAIKMRAAGSIDVWA